MKKVCIDPGHGEKDPGAIGFMGTKEKDIVLKVAKYLKSLLLKNNYLVMLTRENDKFISLPFRTAISNHFNADIFISIHCNSAINKNAHGFEIFTSQGATKADKLAACIANEWSKNFPNVKIRADWSDGDIDKEAGFYVLKHTIAPAVLIELDFISNLEKERELKDSIYLQKMAQTIFNGIQSYFLIGSEEND